MNPTDRTEAKRDILITAWISEHPSSKGTMRMIEALKELDIQDRIDKQLPLDKEMD